LNAWSSLDLDAWSCLDLILAERSLITCNLALNTCLICWGSWSPRETWLKRSPWGERGFFFFFLWHQAKTHVYSQSSQTHWILFIYCVLR
jgi:hypothetical protein